MIAEGPRLKAERVPRTEGDCNFCTDKPEKLWKLESDSPHRMAVIYVCDECAMVLVLKQSLHYEGLMSS